jgi:hypothetical protein
MKRHCSAAASADGRPDIASAVKMQAASFMGCPTFVRFLDAPSVAPVDVHFFRFLHPFR